MRNGGPHSAAFCFRILLHDISFDFVVFRWISFGLESWRMDVVAWCFINVIDCILLTARVLDTEFDIPFGRLWPGKLTLASFGWFRIAARLALLLKAPPKADSEACLGGFEGPPSHWASENDWFTRPQQTFQLRLYFGTKFTPSSRCLMVNLVNMLAQCSGNLSRSLECAVAVQYLTNSDSVVLFVDRSNSKTLRLAFSEPESST